MLYLVLVLVIAAFVLLIVALTTAVTVWAWVSVGISVVAAGLLVFDWLRSRRRVAATTVRRVEEPVGEIRDFEERVSEPPAEPVAAVESPVAEPVVVVDEEEDSGEPGEEGTDAADLLVISELGAEVRVVDEYPRYHLSRCSWLGGKATIPLPVSEARQLGFTPCALCGPDATLAARHRASRGAKQ
jgi:hypothetical protein